MLRGSILRVGQCTQPPTENSLVLPFGVVAVTVTVCPNVALGEANVATPLDEAVAEARYCLPCPPRPAPRDDKKSSTVQPAHVVTTMALRSARVMTGVRMPSFTSALPVVVLAVPNGVRSIASGFGASKIAFFVKRLKFVAWGVWFGGDSSVGWSSMALELNTMTFDGPMMFDFAPASMNTPTPFGAAAPLGRMPMKLYATVLSCAPLS